jgi:hypothetical protein
VVRVERASTRAARLASLYGTVDEVDAFTGMQTERRVAGTELGELQLAIWTRQFTAIRAADPWWSTRDPVLDELAQEYGLVVERSLDQIVRANARTLPEVPEHLFGV